MPKHFLINPASKRPPYGQLALRRTAGSSWRLSRWLLGLIALLLAGAAMAIPPDEDASNGEGVDNSRVHTEHAVAKLLAEHPTVTPGSRLNLALVLDLAPGGTAIGAIPATRANPADPLAPARGRERRPHPLDPAEPSLLASGQ
jgi:hypothetical protein